MDLTSEGGHEMGFSNAFLVALEAWANTPEITKMIMDVSRHESFDKLIGMVSEMGMSRKDILLEALCATISMYLKDSVEVDTCIATGVMFPLAAQLNGLGVIRVAPSN